MEIHSDRNSPTYIALIVNKDFGRRGEGGRVPAPWWEDQDQRQRAEEDSSEENKLVKWLRNVPATVGDIDVHLCATKIEALLLYMVLRKGSGRTEERKKETPPPWCQSSTSAFVFSHVSRIQFYFVEKSAFCMLCMISYCISGSELKKFTYYIAYYRRIHHAKRNAMTQTPKGWLLWRCWEVLQVHPKNKSMLTSSVWGKSISISFVTVLHDVMKMGSLGWNVDMGRLQMNYIYLYHFFNLMKGVHEEPNYLISILSCLFLLVISCISLNNTKQSSC